MRKSTGFVKWRQRQEGFDACETINKTLVCFVCSKDETDRSSTKMSKEREHSRAPSLRITERRLYGNVTNHDEMLPNSCGTGLCPL
jgi:hypothetical protein